MTISSFCRAELLEHGPLSATELGTRAVAAGVTRARDPIATVTSAIRRSELRLLDGRWATPLQLLEGRCLTTRLLPRRQVWSTEPDPDLGLLGPTAYELSADGRALVPGPGEVLCVRVRDGRAEVRTIPEPGTGGVAALAERLEAPAVWDYELRRSALRGVAQLMVDEPTTFRMPLPPLSTWVPGLVEASRQEEEAMRGMLAWEREQRRHVQVVLDDCQAIDVALAAEEAGLPVDRWITEAIDRAISEERAGADARGRVVFSLSDRR